MTSNKVRAQKTQNWPKLVLFKHPLSEFLINPILENLQHLSLWLESVPDKKTFPTLEKSLQTDIVIVGGGIVGLMTAWNFVTKGFKVIVLEKNHIATGDTAATTGFLTRVPDTSLHGLQLKYGNDFLTKLFQCSGEAQQSIFDLIKNKAIDCDFRQCDSYYGTYQTGDGFVWNKNFCSIQNLDNDWNTLEKISAAGASFVDDKSHEKFPFASAIRFQDEGSFNSRKFIFGLIEILKGPNFEIYEESEVLEVDALGDRHACPLIAKTAKGQVSAKKMIMATGQPIDAFNEVRSLVKSKLSYVIAAKYKDMPLADGLFWDTYEPYYYYRKTDDNTLIIGGADIAFDRAAAQKPFEILENFLKKYLPGNFEITNQWSGSLFDSGDGLPYAFEHPHYRGKVFVATGFGGNGLVFGALAAQTLFDLATSATTERTRLLALERTGAVIPKPGAVGTICRDRTLFCPYKLSLQQKKAFVQFANLTEFDKISYVKKVINGQSITVYKLSDGFHAIDNTCTHAGGSLCDGTFDGTVVECPLHGAKFAVKTGEVVAPPAVRPLQKYNIRVNGNFVEVEVGAHLQDGAVQKKQTTWGYLLKFSLAACLFWFTEFILQYYFLIRGELKGSFIRSFALSGATLFGFALFSSAVFKWIPRYAVHWRLRRYLGVSGFIFIFFHVLSVLFFYFNFDTASVYYSFNPIENPLIFGSIAFPIFLIMALTSTDWAVTKLTPKIWKNIHRLVYIAYWAAIFHFILINPALLNNIAGYLLLTVTALALFGQTFWFFKMSAKKAFKSWGTIAGIIMILLYIITAYLAYKYKFASPKN